MNQTEHKHHGGSTPLEQHNLEIRQNRAHWARKPLLQQVYRGFYSQILGRVDRDVPGAIVEIGSGMGNIKEVIPDCVTTDVFANEWLDRQENVYRLSYASRTVSNLILVDVWHHLRYPGTVLDEFRRVLAPGGRVILLEPAMSWLGRVVYGLFHHEPLGLGDRLEWRAPASFAPEHADYFAAQSSATRHFWWQAYPERLVGWQIVEVTPLPGLLYFATGGFSGPTVARPSLLWFFRTLDRLAARFPRLLAARLLVVLSPSGPS